MPDAAAAVLVSVKPQYARAIAAGTKTVELRRRFPKVRAGMWLVLYATLPVGAVVGMVLIRDVDEQHPEQLWVEHRDSTGITKALFDAYFAGCENGCAVRLGEYVPLDPVSPAEMSAILPGFRPPQSFRYLKSEALGRIASGQAGELIVYTALRASPGAAGPA